MPDYVVHIGPHKTGTTYLQRGFTRLAAPLAAAGIHYPLDLGTPGHALLARGLADPDTLSSKFAALNASDANLVLLSAEDLSPLRPPAIAALHRLIGDNPARIVFTCRRWSDLLASHWVERVKRGHCGTLAEHLAAALADPAASPQMNYARVLDRWAAVFGKASLRLICLQAVSDAGIGLGAHFHRELLDVALPDADVDDGRNPSLPLIEAELLRALNTLHRDHGHAPDSAWRKIFIRARRHRRLQLERSTAAMASDVSVYTVDETALPLAALHDSLHERYRNRIVPPTLRAGFFTPTIVPISHVTGRYIDAPGVRSELAAAYAAMVKAARARALATTQPAVVSARQFP